MEDSSEMSGKRPKYEKSESIVNFDALTRSIDENGGGGSVDESHVLLVTFNMSFLNDLEKPLKDAVWASEYVFLLNNTTGDRRAFFKNGLQTLNELIRYCKERGLPCVIGLQEMNLTEPGSNTGTDSVNQILQAINVEKQTNFIQVCDKVVVNENQQPALSIIYNTQDFGNVDKVKIVDNIYNANDKNRQAGRPLLMVVTDRNAVFINFHGSQDPSSLKRTTDGQSFTFHDFNTRWMAMNEEFIETSVTAFLTEHRPNAPQLLIYCMTDSNDRFNIKTSFNFMAGDVPYTISHNEVKPLSCCHNHDSSCLRDVAGYDENADIGGQPKELNRAKFYPLSPGSNCGTCSTDHKKKFKDPVSGKEINPLKELIIPEEASAPYNYVYSGDVCLSLHPIGVPFLLLTREGIFISDHQLVCALAHFFPFAGKPAAVPMEAGIRKRRRTRRRSRKHHNRHNEKMQKKNKKKSRRL
jgi:hypothetical protein